MKAAEIIRKDSPQARKGDFRFTVCGKHFFADEITVIRKESECPSCKVHFTVEQLKEAEGDCPEGYDAEAEKIKREKRRKIREISWRITVLLIFLLLVLPGRGGTILSEDRDRAVCADRSVGGAQVKASGRKNRTVICRPVLLHIFRRCFPC